MPSQAKIIEGEKPPDDKRIWLDENVSQMEH